MDASERTRVVRREAEGLGFARVGICDAAPFERHTRFVEWIAAGYAGRMSYLERGVEQRRSVTELLGDARTIVSVALALGSAGEPVPASRLGRGPAGRLARYAQGEDYHLVLKARLLELGRRLSTALGAPVAQLTCVDTAPVLEREAAARAGVGFIGKNTMVIAPGLGSQVVLGELLLSVECAPDEPALPRCGECRACLEACPTGAFVGEFVLDARRCISYLTIENPEEIPRELRRAIGDRIFGCDVCQDVCPFNQSPGASTAVPARTQPRNVDLVELLELGSAQFRKWNRRSAMRRIHRGQLRRNVAVALGNVGTPAEVAALGRALDDPLPLVRTHVTWALGEIARRHPSAAAGIDARLAEREAIERDTGVLGELEAARTAAGV